MQNDGLQFTLLMKNWVQNSLLVFGSFALILLITEYVILQFFIPTTDVARVEFKEELIRYKHNQRGVTKLSNEFSAEFSINQQGWNSHHKLYSINKNNKHKNRCYWGFLYRRPGIRL